MKSPTKLLSFSATLLLCASAAVGASVGGAVAAVQRERIQSAYLIAFGRLASNDEVKYWTGQNPKSVAEIVQRHSAYIGSQPSAKTEVITRAYIDAFGRTPNKEEIAYWAKGGDNYTSLTQKHLQFLKGNAAEYEKVIRRSYQKVLNRTPNAAEVSHWKGQGVHAYYVLAACHEDWKRRGGEGQASAKSVSSSNSFLATVTVSPSVLSEAKVSVSSLIGNDGGSMVAAGGGNMVAAGAGNMVAAGGGNMVAAGAGNMVAAGGGN